MGEPPKKFTPSFQEDLFVGKLEGEQFSGVYLPTDYLARLSEVLNAAKIRINKSSSEEYPDAIKNLMGILGRMLELHHEHTQEEREEREEQNRRSQDELRKAVEQLSEINNDPGRA